MFNLEQAIAKWRRRMCAAGIKTPVPLDELENHLREGVEQQTRSGADPEQAFHRMVERIGAAGKLEEEFGKIEDLKRMKSRELLRRWSVVAGTGFVYAMLSGTWYLGARSGKMEITWFEIVLGLGAIAPMILLGWAGRSVATLLPIICEGWVIAITLMSLFLAALLFRVVLPVISPDNVVHLQVTFLWVLSPMMGFGNCVSAWFDRCVAVRKESYQYV